MEDEFAPWRALALQTYSLAWRELLSAQAMQRDDVRFYVDELKEALLDLKQATIDEDSARVMDSVDEVNTLLFDLRHLLYGGE